MTAPRLSPERIEEIRARLEAATPGPWRLGFPLGRCALDHAHRFGHCNYRFTNWLDSDSIASDPGFRPGDQYRDTTVITPLEGSTPESADLALIANAPAYLTALLRELDLMRADATAALDAAARGGRGATGLTPARGEDAVDHLGDLAALYRRALDAERVRDLLTETASRLTRERDAARGSAARLERAMKDARWALGCGPSDDLAATGAAVMAEARDNLDALRYLEEISTTRDGFWVVPPVLSLPVRRYDSAFVGSVLASAAAQDAIDEATNDPR